MPQATLTKDGKRVAIDIGSPQEKDLFSQGYKLETTPPGNLQGTMGGDTPEINSSEINLPDVTKSTTQFSAMKNMLNKIAEQSYANKPSVSSLLADFNKSIKAGSGVVNPAITGAVISDATSRKENSIATLYSNTMRTIGELETAKSNRDKMVYSLISDWANSGLLGEITGKDYDYLLQNGVPSMETLQKISNVINNPEKKQVAQLISDYPDAGIVYSDNLESASAKLKNSRIYQDKVRAPVGGGGGGGTEAGGYPKGFWSSIKTSVDSLQKGEQWGTVFDRIKMQYPTVSNEDIDKALGTQWREQGAFEEYKSKQYKPTEPAKFEQESIVWQWLASPEAQGMSDEQKKQEIMSAGFNPEDFGIY